MAVLKKKKAVAPVLHPLEKATVVSYEAFDAFRAAQNGLAESNAILEDFSADQLAYIESIRAELDAANEQVQRNNALAAKLAEFTDA